MTVAAAWDEPAQLVRGVMKDFSELGARILLDDDSQTPPDAFDLIQISTGALFEARVVWRADQYLGVVFERSIQLKGAQEPRLMKRAHTHGPCSHISCFFTDSARHFWLLRAR